MTTSCLPPRSRRTRREPSAKIRSLFVLAAVSAALLVPAGCTNPFFRDPRVSKQAQAADFSLELHVDGQIAEAPRVHYVLEANRRLHARAEVPTALPAVAPTSRTLEPAEFNELYAIITEEKLIDSPPASAKELADLPSDTGPRRFRAIITARARTTRYIVLPGVSPGTDRLIARLDALAFRATPQR